MNEKPDDFTYEDDAAAAAPTDADLASIAELAQRQVDAEAEVTQLEADLKDAQARLRQVAEADLPEALGRVGLSEFTLKSGHKIGVTTIVRASIPKATQGEAFAWLEENNAGDLIKEDVDVQFGRGEGGLAQSLLSIVRSTFPAQKLTHKRGVNPQTLGAFVREQLGAGADLPLDLLGVFIQKRATVTPPKAANII